LLAPGDPTSLPLRKNIQISSPKAFDAPIMPDNQPLTSLPLTSLGAGLNAAIIGASGGIGGAFVDHLAESDSVQRIFGLSRSAPTPPNRKLSWHRLDLEDEGSIAEAATAVLQTADELHLVVVATGILHDGERLRPEKTWRAITGPGMERVFRLNTIGPSLVAKHFLPLLASQRKSVFAAISAKVGSVEDNHLGGWHAYRASKAALNMVIKTLAIELARRNPQALCVGLHPGTTDTALSKPFQGGVPAEKLFTPAYSAGRLLTVIDGLTHEDSGQLYSWDGRRIPF
jgi:NAD(P)-dependent dehydrogenase (short-subunit alcohol dehydrogenase family)